MGSNPPVVFTKPWGSPRATDGIKHANGSSQDTDKKKIGNELLLPIAYSEERLVAPPRPDMSPSQAGDSHETDHQETSVGGCPRARYESSTSWGMHSLGNRSWDGMADILNSHIAHKYSGISGTQTQQIIARPQVPKADLFQRRSDQDRTPHPRRRHSRLGSALRSIHRRQNRQR